MTFGRNAIYTDVVEITAANVADILDAAVQEHQNNRSDIQYLYDVYRGKADILNRVKEIRPEINNMVPVNYPYRIVRFKTGYEFGEPIQYVAKSGENAYIEQFNAYMNEVDKDTQDIEMSDWIYIAGVGYRYCNSDAEALPDESPFKTSVLDPRFTFCVYDRTIDHKQKLCCTFSEDEDGKATYYVYTDDTYYVINSDFGIVSSEPYYEVEQPIVEYYYNAAHMGAFEVVMSIINAINRVTSNRLDGIEQFIQSLMMFKGVNITADDYQTLKEEGAILVPPDGDVKFLVQELNQEQTQTFIDSLYQEMLEIVGMPNRSQSSGGDNGIAVIYRDGWSDCESYAKSDEKMFKRGEKKFLRIALNICNNQRGMNLKLNDISINFTRRNYENIAAKSEVLTSMLGSPKIHPKLAFLASGMFPDPETAYAMSKEYEEQQERLQLDELNAELENARTEAEGEVNADAEEETA